MPVRTWEEARASTYRPAGFDIAGERGKSEHAQHDCGWDRLLRSEARMFSPMFWCWVTVIAAAILLTLEEIADK